MCMKKLLITFALFSASLMAQHEVSVSGGLAVPRDPTAVKVAAGAGYAYKFGTGHKNGYVTGDQLTLSYGYTALSGVPLRKGGYGAHTALLGYKHSYRSSINRIGVFYGGGAGFTTVTNLSATFTKATGQFGGGLFCDISDLYPGISVTFGFYGNKIATVPLFFSTALGIGKSF